MRFANPQVLWLLLVLPPLLLGFLVWAWKVRQKLLTSFVQARLLPGLLAGVSPARVKIRAALLCLALVFLIVALARPQWGFRWEEVKMRGLDIVVAIDTSRSMLAEDIAPNRLARAKLAALDLVQQAKTDRLGLIAFAGSAFLQCPLTTDDAAFRQCVESLDVRIIPDGGTALAEAIKTASTAFKEGDNYKVLVLFSDGEDQDQGAVEAAREAAKAGLRIFTIGFGKPEGELLRIPQPNGTSDYIRDEEGNVVKSRLNEDLLRQIASATEGGFYLPMQGAKPIETLYAKGLAPLPKSESGERLVKRYFERYHWPLAVAIALILAELLFPERKREPRPAAAGGLGLGRRGKEAPVSVGGLSTSPATKTPSRPPPIPVSVAGLFLCLVLPWSSLASNSGALREYKAGNFDKAQQEFERLLQKNQDDLRYQFNAGAAAYKNRQYNQAAEHFGKALNSTDIKLQEKAYFNRGNTLFHLGENTPEPQKKIETWEKSLRDFDATTKLNPQDADAKHNADLVKRLLEELKQQQQQQQQQDQNKDDQQQKQDQQKDQQPQNNQQQQQDQKQDQQSQQNQDQQQKDQQQQQQQQENQEQQQKDSQQSGQKGKPDQQKQNQPPQQSAGEPKDNEQQQQPEESYAPGQMTPQQARQLLDAQKSDEKMLPIRPVKPVDPSRRLRDW